MSRSWLFHVVTRWVGAWPVPVVAGAVAADVHLLGHQLGPVLALRHGLGCRFLLADAVGAGKTIEAALVLSELAARGLAHRVLVLTPATLRDQWRDELAHRAAISAGVIDRAAIRNRARDVAAEEGPWQPPGVHVMSTELAKQPDVLAGLCAVCWDAVIVDEAHGVAGDSARTAAVRAISARARVLLLLSATPHAGSDAAFSRLCSLGRLPGEPPPLVFARRRADGPPLRHRDVRTRPGTDERRYLRALTRYAVALERCSSPGAALAALVLRKRALSSPHALLCSLRHRLRCLRPLAGAVQDLLPFDDTGEQEHDDVDQPLVLGAAGFQDVTREIGVIEELLASIEAAGLRWSKADALLRLVRRTSERVLIFTEYRDTLTALAAMLSAETGVSALHGGLDRFARSEAIAQFTSGAVRIMVATDVAAEGLNLQHGCRLAVHVELPWSPARLEQRNGRVNRLGQTQPVHVWRLLGERGLESRIVGALSARLARMRESGFGPLAVPMPRECEAVVSAAGPGTLPADVATIVRLDEDEAAAVQATAMVRRLHAFALRRRAGPAGPGRPRACWMRARPVAGGVPPGVTCVFLSRPGGTGDRAVLVPVHLALAALPAGAPGQWLPPLVTRAAAAVAVSGDDRLRQTLRSREAALLADATEEFERQSRRWQPSLFDRRAARIAAAAREAARARLIEHQRRVAQLSTRPSLPPVPVLVLVVQ